MTDTSTLLSLAQIDTVTKLIPGFSVPEWTMTLAGHAGSNRRFVRVQHNDKSYIVVVWNSTDSDWNNFITIGHYAPYAPQIYNYNAVAGLIIEEDAGTTTLKDLCSEQPDFAFYAYKKVLDTLASWQLTLKIKNCTPIQSRSMDYATFTWESSYFAEHCVQGLFGLGSMLTDEWEKERNALAYAASVLPQVPIHRDFQSENICMQDNGSVLFVDYQGARMGPAAYDVASLLYDPYIVLLTDVQRSQLLTYYRTKIFGIEADFTDKDYAVCALQRLMQALGAYGNLSINKGKPHYRAFVPIALERCLSIAQTIPEAQCLTEILKACIKKQITLPGIS